MPTVLLVFEGWRVVIYPNDHRPPHVHVLGADEHGRFELLCETYLLDHFSHFCSE